MILYYIVVSVSDTKTLYINKKVPCNDGGLSLGQLWIAHQKNI